MPANAELPFDYPPLRRPPRQTRQRTARLQRLPQCWRSATPEAIQVLKEADLILFGPSSFLTSIMPPILLPEITEQLRQSEAKKIFIDNLGIEHSPASSLSLADRIHWINETVGQPIIDGAIVPFNAVQNSQSMEIKILAGRLNADDIETLFPTQGEFLVYEFPPELEMKAGYVGALLNPTKSAIEFFQLLHSQRAKQGIQNHGFLPE